MNRLRRTCIFWPDVFRLLWFHQYEISNWCTPSRVRAQLIYWFH